MGHEIIAIDEVGFQLQTNFKQIWFEKCKKPKGAFFWSNKKLIVFGAQRQNHKLYYEFHIAQNSMTFLSFLSGLFETLDLNKNYVLILDNAGWHKTQIVQKYIAKQKNVKVEFIPPYSPELNPIETNWKVTRNAVTKSQLFSSIDDLQSALEDFWSEHIFTQNFIGYLCR
ncbi:IS630 family transposase [Candidatus Woesearchaeota archaeon]|nr:IS630 family transposase [Candidatus Woesearchaeota archaeon]